MTDAQTANGNAPAKRRRGPPRRASVEAIEYPTPQLVRVTFAGEQLAGFGPPRPGGHIKLFFPDAGSDWSPDQADAPRPPSRTYTPLRYDPDQCRLDVEFVRHGSGLATGWADQAKIGDSLYIAGPGGGYDLAEDLTDLVLIADDTAIPAASTILAELDVDTRATALFEVADAGEERMLPSAAQVDVAWLHRDETGGDPAAALEAATRGLKVPAGAYWWVACEAGAMRRIRQYLLGELSVPVAHIHTRGYWRRGEFNYPDHDYGLD